MYLFVCIHQTFSGVLIGCTFYILDSILQNFLLASMHFKVFPRFKPKTFMKSSFSNIRKISKLSIPFFTHASLAKPIPKFSKNLSKCSR